MCLILVVEVFIKVMNGLFYDESRGRQEISMCLAVLLCEYRYFKPHYQNFPQVLTPASTFALKFLVVFVN